MNRRSILSLFLAAAFAAFAGVAPRAQEAEATKKETFVIFKTTMGTFVAVLEMERTPLTAGNFKGLADGSKEWTDPKTGQKVNRPFYDGLTFHRVAKGFVIQGGCPLGTGTGGPGYMIKREIVPALRHKKGSLSMARSQNPDSAGSQFFVCLEDTPALDDGYAVFGHVVAGQEVVDAIGKVRITPQMGPNDGRPVETVTMERVVVVEGTKADYEAKLAELNAPAEAEAAPAVEAPAAP